MKNSNQVGNIALIFAIVGTALIYVPLGFFFAGLFLFAAFILAIVGLTNKKRKTTSVISLIVLMTNIIAPAVIVFMIQQ